MALPIVPRIVLRLNAPRRGRAPMFKAKNNMLRPYQPVSLEVKFAFYAATTLIGSWVAFCVVGKGW